VLLLVRNYSMRCVATFAFSGIQRSTVAPLYVLFPLAFFTDIHASYRRQFY
jgi:hypothetical protein